MIPDRQRASYVGLEVAMTAKISQVKLPVNDSGPRDNKTTKQ